MTAKKPTRARQLGVTDEEYARLLAAQGGHCALCPNTPKSRKLHADHDHASGKVRALLCHRCNRALPTWITSEWLRRAADYLDAHDRRKRALARIPEFPPNLGHSGQVSAYREATKLRDGWPS